MSTELMLFGVRIDVDPMRKIASMNNLADYQHVADLGKGSEKEIKDGGGYVSDDGGRARARDRKRGTPWSEEEHKLFLMGLKKVGKGDWRGISKNFVKTRTPTQVASHAQKYFLRHNTVKRRRRSSLFDITTEMIANKLTLEDHETTNGKSASSKPAPNSSNTAVYPMVPVPPAPNSSEAAVYPMMPVLPLSPQLPSLLVSPVPFPYPSESTVPLQVTQQPMVIIPAPPPPLPLPPVPTPTSNAPPKYSPLSLNLSLSLSADSPASPNPAFKTTSAFITQDSYISVA